MLRDSSRKPKIVKNRVPGILINPIYELRYNTKGASKILNVNKKLDLP